MTAPEEDKPAPPLPAGVVWDPESVFESARFVASVSLTIGAVMLSLFGIVERLATFERIAVERELALTALLPGIATLCFLACARAVSWMISNMRFKLWRDVIPPHRRQVLEERMEHGNQFHFRVSLMSGAYGLFTLVIAAMAATSAGLAFGLAAFELGLPRLPTGLTAAAVTAALVINEMLTRDRPAKSAATAIFVGVLIATLVMDVVF